MDEINKNIKENDLFHLIFESMAKVSEIEENKTSQEKQLRISVEYARRANSFRRKQIRAFLSKLNRFRERRSEMMREVLNLYKSKPWIERVIERARHFLLGDSRLLRLLEALNEADEEDEQSIIKYRHVEIKARDITALMG